MCEIVGGVVLGALVGGSASKFSWHRPLRFIIREGIRTQRKLTEVVADIRTEARRLVAEAREELDHPDHASDSSTSASL